MDNGYFTEFIVLAAIVGGIAAYSIAMSRSYILLHKIIKKIPIRGDIRVTMIEVIILVGLLLAGGFIEYFLIENIPTSTPKI